MHGKIMFIELTCLKWCMLCWVCKERLLFTLNNYQIYMDSDQNSLFYIEFDTCTVLLYCRYDRRLIWSFTSLPFRPTSIDDNYIINNTDITSYYVRCNSFERSMFMILK